MLIIIIGEIILAAERRSAAPTITCFVTGIL